MNERMFIGAMMMIELICGMVLLILHMFWLNKFKGDKK